MIIAIVIARSVGMCLPLGRGDIILVVGELVVSGGTKGQKLLGLVLVIRYSQVAGSM